MQGYFKMKCTYPEISVSYTMFICIYFLYRINVTPLQKIEVLKSSGFGDESRSMYLSTNSGAITNQRFINLIERIVNPFINKSKPLYI